MAVQKQDFDYRDYISFVMPESARSLFSSFEIDPDQFRLPDQTIDTVSRALEEIAATPEGQDLIRTAAEKSTLGEVLIIYEENMAQVLDGGISLGSQYTGRYAGAETGEMHDTTIQSVLFHELYHIANGHASFDTAFRGAESRLAKENDTVIATNDFMEKYYGEPRRGNYLQTDVNGTDEWDYNPKFSIEGHATPEEQFLNQIKILPPEIFASASPELQSLHEIAGSKELFFAHLKNIGADGMMGALTEELNDISHKHYLDEDTRTIIDRMMSIPATNVTREDTPAPVHPAFQP